MNKKKLFIITASYPYSIAKEDTFLNPEIKVLKKYFEVHIIPLLIKGEICDCDKEVFIHTDFGKKYRFGKFYLILKIPNAIFNKLFYREIIDNPYIIFELSKLKSLISFIIRVHSFYKYLYKKNKKERGIFDGSILYTYWFDFATTAIVNFSLKNRKVKTITRAHGYDLYEFRRKNKYFPLRTYTLKYIDRVFLVSNNGCNYLTQRYPVYRRKFYISPLGVENKGILNKPSNDGVFRIVSCSYLNPVKRVDMIIDSLSILSEKIKIPIEWYHIGGGMLFDYIKNYAAKKLEGKVKYKLFGDVSNEQVFEFYKTQPLDLFITLSESEGGRSVSVMEAISVGLPVVATDVGGLPEIVINNRNGILLPKDVTPEVVADEISKLIKDHYKLINMRKESVKVWQEFANAEINFEQFAKKLLELAEEPLPEIS